MSSVDRGFGRLLDGYVAPAEVVRAQQKANVQAAIDKATEHMTDAEKTSTKTWLFAEQQWQQSERARVSREASTAAKVDARDRGFGRYLPASKDVKA